MHFKRLALADCKRAEGVVVVIDVLRAFSTSAFAYQGGIQEIYAVATVEEGLNLGRKLGALTAGEGKGEKIKEFDFDNSPSQLAAHNNLQGRILVQRTSNGTQGIVCKPETKHLIAASLVCARATARFIAGMNAETVTFILTGLNADDRADEDAACADYLEALLCGQAPPVNIYADRVRNSQNGRTFITRGKHFPADLDLACQVDRFDFVMPVERKDGHFVIRKCSI